MHRMLALAFWVVASAVLMSQPARAETPADTLVVAQNLDDIISIDPAYVFEISGGEIVRNAYDTLINFEPDSPTVIGPAAAESWTVSDDGSVFTFKLREGMTFHSGNPVTADDAVWSLKRIIKLNAVATWYTQALGWNADNIDEAVQKVDPLTVRIEMMADMAPKLALAYMTTVMTSVIDSKEAMAHEVDGDMGKEWLKTNAAGSGPFKLRTMDPTQTVLFEAFGDYWAGAPNMKRLVIQHVPEPSTQRLLLEKGDADVARNLPSDQLTAIADDEALKVQSDKSLEVIYLAANQGVPELSNTKVWEAIKLLIDYKGMEENLLNGSMTVAQTFWPFDENAIPNIYELDIEKAKALVVEAGYADGFKVTMEVFNEPPFLQMAQSLKSTFAKAGIELEIVPGEKKSVYSKFRSRDFDMAMMHLAADFLDPDAFTAFFTRNADNSDEANLAGQLAWRTKWFIPGLTELTALAKAEMDEAKRTRMYHALQLSVQQNSPFAIMFLRQYQTAMAAGVTGFWRAPPWDGMYYRGVNKE